MIALILSYLTEALLKVVDQRGVAKAERVRFVLNKVNDDAAILPNVTLGMVALDDCQRDVGALAQSGWFIFVLNKNIHTKL